MTGEEIEKIHTEAQLRKHDRESAENAGANKKAPKMQDFKKIKGSHTNFACNKLEGKNQIAYELCILKTSQNIPSWKLSETEF